MKKFILAISIIFAFTGCSEIMESIDIDKILDSDKISDVILEKLEKKNKPDVLNVKQHNVVVASVGSNLEIYADTCNATAMRNGAALPLTCKGAYIYTVVPSLAGSNDVVVTIDGKVVGSTQYNYTPPVQTGAKVIIKNILMPASGVCPEGFVPCGARTNCLKYGYR